MNEQKEKKLQRFVKVGLVVSLTLVLFLSGLFVWRQRVIQQQEQGRFQRATQRLQEGHALEALEIIEAQEQITPFAATRTPSRWIALKVQALTRTGNITLLQSLYRRSPSSVLANEEATLLLARATAVSSRKDRFDQFKQFHKVWQKTRHPEWWLVAEADFFLITGKQHQAEKLLRSRRFPGKADIGRLTRLAMLTLPQNRRAAWDLLTEAFLRDPKNPDVRTFRAEMLEASGKIPAAQVEYVAAFLAHPQDPLHCDTLAEFYRRQQALHNAVQTWVDGRKSGADSDIIRVKAEFWSRVAYPLVFALPERNTSPCPPGNLHTLADYLTKLPADRFWDTEQFDSLIRARRFEKTRQETYWLILLDTLQSGEEKTALYKIQENPFRNISYYPSLERALLRILTYRRTGRWNIDPTAFPALPNENLPTFFQMLESYANGAPVPPDEQKLLKGKNAFAAAFLSAGWLEAGLRLYVPEADTEDSPAWFAYGIGQALRSNRKPQEAQRYVQSRTVRTPALNLLAAELRIANGEEVAALEDLKPLASLSSGVGYRAAWLLALGRLEQRRFSDAEQVIASQPQLRDSDTGTEMRARIALAKNDLPRAERLYNSIAATSGEAKSFLARQAFAHHNFPEARKRTWELLALYPDALELRENLQEIDKAEKGVIAKP